MEWNEYYNIKIGVQGTDGKSWGMLKTEKVGGQKDDKQNHQKSV